MPFLGKGFGFSLIYNRLLKDFKDESSAFALDWKPLIIENIIFINTTNGPLGKIEFLKENLTGHSSMLKKLSYFCCREKCSLD